MVQFHPTGLLAGPETRMTGTVLEEGLRGAGGWLLNGAGARFMADYHPHGERATRDVVSRAIYAEMRAGRTSPLGGVYVEMKHLGPEAVRRQFKGMVERCAGRSRCRARADRSAVDRGSLQRSRLAGHGGWCLRA